MASRLSRLEGYHYTQRLFEWVDIRTRQRFARFASLVVHEERRACMAKVRSRSKATRAQPLLAAAVFCENYLEDKEGLSTLIRVLDGITVAQPPELPPAPKGGKQPESAVAVLAFVSFRSGEAKGEYDLRIDMVSPSGERKSCWWRTTKSTSGWRSNTCNAPA